MIRGTGLPDVEIDIRCSRSNYHFAEQSEIFFCMARHLGLRYSFFGIQAQRSRQY